MITLYTYFRSTASYRVRIVLNLKKIPYESTTLDLRLSEHKDENYLNLNPQGLVPFFKDGHFSTAQSLVIIDYLEEIYSTPSIYPSDQVLKYKVKELAQYIASEMHPLNNLRVLKYLTDTLEITEEQKTTWYHHWLKEGFDVLEVELSEYNTPCALSEKPSLLDACLIPQIYNALRFKFDMSAYPRLMSVYKHCLEQEAFIKASPEMQEDCDI